MGDVPAVWITQVVSSAGISLHDSVGRFQSNLREYLVHEQGMVPTVREFASFREHIGQLRDDLARLEKRIHKLQAAKGVAGAQSLQPSNSRASS